MVLSIVRSNHSWAHDLERPCWPAKVYHPEGNLNIYNIDAVMTDHAHNKHLCISCDAFWTAEHVYTCAGLKIKWIVLTIPRQRLNYHNLHKLADLSRCTASLQIKFHWHHSNATIPACCGVRQPLEFLVLYEIILYLVSVTLYARHSSNLTTGIWRPWGLIRSSCRMGFNEFQWYRRMTSKASQGHVGEAHAAVSSNGRKQ